MSIASIKDAIKALAQSLQVTTVFPAALLVLVNAYIVLPALGLDIDFSAPLTVTVVVSLTLMLSYTLYAFNFPLIRFLEGYKLQDSDLFRGALERSREAFKSLEERIGIMRYLDQAYRDLLAEIDRDAQTPEPFLKVRIEEWQEIKQDLARSEYSLDQDFPSSVESVLPTRLGNTIAAFEDYPRTRYGMEPIVLWGHLVPLLREKQFLEFVTQEKAVFDFLLNTTLVVACLGFELFYLCLFLGRFLLAIGVLGLAFVLVWVLYRGMIVAARQWGTTVRVAFDLYRHDLSRRLGLRPAKSFRQEVKRWQAVSRFLLYRPEVVGGRFKGFLSQRELTRLERKTRDST